jgi:hypothetical protein
MATGRARAGVASFLFDRVGADGKKPEPPSWSAFAQTAA